MILNYRQLQFAGNAVNVLLYGALTVQLCMSFAHQYLIPLCTKATLL